MNVFDYFDEIERACERRSIPCDLQFGAMHGSNDRRGRILGYLTFECGERADARLRVSELVMIDDNERPHVIEYAYFLVVDGVEFWGWECDLSHDPPVHRHTREHERHDADRITLPEVIERAWDEISDYLQQLDDDAS